MSHLRARIGTPILGGAANRVLYQDGSQNLATNTNFTYNGTRLTIVGTTEQLRVGYDGTNYMSVTVGSSGEAAFNVAGAVPTFLFSKATHFNAGTGSSWIPYIDGKIYLSASEIVLRNASDVAYTVFTPTQVSWASGMVFSFPGTGVKIGASSSEKLAFFGKSPIARLTAPSVAIPVDVTGSDTVDKDRVNENFAEVYASLNAIIQVLIDYGLLV